MERICERKLSFSAGASNGCRFVSCVLHGVMPPAHPLTPALTVTHSAHPSRHTNSHPHIYAHIHVPHPLRTNSCTHPRVHTHIRACKHTSVRANANFSTHTSTHSNVHKAAYLFQASLLVLDDVMDGSPLRRGRASWHANPQVGIAAVNDGLFLENCVFLLLE